MPKKGKLEYIKTNPSPNTRVTTTVKELKRIYSAGKRGAHLKLKVKKANPSWRKTKKAVTSSLTPEERREMGPHPPKPRKSAGRSKTGKRPSGYRQNAKRRKKGGCR